MKFELLEKEYVYVGRAFSVARLKARLPNGNTRSFDLVDHANSVTVIPIDEEGNILFVRQYRLGADDMLLELPAGVQDPEEDPLACAAREVREETGLAARELKELGQYYLAPGYSNEKMVAYLATGLYDSPLDADEDEFIETEAIPVAQVYEMAARGVIQDGKTLAALLLARPHLIGA